MINPSEGSKKQGLQNIDEWIEKLNNKRCQSLLKQSENQHRCGERKQ